MLKEGVDYRVKVSFKVRRVCGVLCPTTGSPPQGVLVTLGSCPSGSLLPPMGPCLGTSASTLYPWALCPSGGLCPP